MALPRPGVPAGCPLSPREFETVTLLAEGLGRREIAARRGVSNSTVCSQVHAASKKLGAHTAGQLVALAHSSGWLDMIDTEWEDIRLTAGHSLYLAAFERWLRDPSDENLAERVFWLRGIFYEAHIVPPWEVLGIPQQVRGAGGHSVGG